MAVKSKPKRVILKPDRPPDSFTIAQLRQALRELAASRPNRKQGIRAHDSK
jgi:hypothetical protein